MYPGCEFVFCRRAKGEKGRSNTRNRVSCVGPFVSFRPFGVFFCSSKHAAQIKHDSLKHLACLQVQVCVLGKSNRAICKI